MMPTRTAVSDSVRLVNQNMLTRIADAAGEYSDCDSGMKMLLGGSCPLDVALSCSEIRARSLTESSSGSGLSQRYDSTVNAVTAAEKRPACNP